MLNKDELTEVLNNYFEKTETEQEMMEFNCTLLSFAKEICQAFADEDDESSNAEMENNTVKWEDAAGETYIS